MSISIATQCSSPLCQICSWASKHEVVDVNNQEKLERIMEEHTVPNTFQQWPPLVLSKTSLEMILPQATAVNMTRQCQIKGDNGSLHLPIHSLGKRSRGSPTHVAMPSNNACVYAKSRLPPCTQGKNQVQHRLLIVLINHTVSLKNGSAFVLPARVAHSKLASLEVTSLKDTGYMSLFPFCLGFSNNRLALFYPRLVPGTLASELLPFDIQSFLRFRSVCNSERGAVINKALTKSSQLSLICSSITAATHARCSSTVFPFLLIVTGVAGAKVSGTAEATAAGDGSFVTVPP